jgi:hypothetical protein
VCVFVCVCVMWVNWYEGCLSKRGESYRGDMVGKEENSIRANFYSFVTSIGITHSAICLIWQLSGVLQS